MIDRQQIPPASHPVTPGEPFRNDVLRGLRQSPKELPCKYFYDAAGAALFERICELPEYYLTRTELGIMHAHAREMADLLGSRCLLFEYGCGSGVKTRLLLEHLKEPVAYLPMDVAHESLQQLTAFLAGHFPHLRTVPLHADFAGPFPALPLPGPAQRRAVYFPGSTLGNFTADAAAGLLRRAAALCGPGGALLLGADLQKDPAVLHRAYNDGQGVTAAFNLNLLARINRELGADFHLDQFWHYALYNPVAGRIEMYLVSRREQRVQVAGGAFLFREGEAILTEYSCKYTLGILRELAARGGWEVRRVWTDDEKSFGVLYLVAVVGA